MDDFVREFAASRTIDAEAARGEIEQFLGASVESVNASQRVVLVAEHFDFEVLATAEWLAERYGLTIKCVKIALRTDEGNLYMTAETIFPSSALFDHAWRRRSSDRAASAPTPLLTWDEIYGQIANDAVRELAQQIAPTLPPKDTNVKGWSLYWRIGGKRTVNIELRREFAYVWQARRFVGDEGFWLDRLEPEIDLQEVQEGRALRFYLRTKAQCEAFLGAQGELGAQNYSIESL